MSKPPIEKEDEPLFTHFQSLQPDVPIPPVRRYYRVTKSVPVPDGARAKRVRKTLLDYFPFKQMKVGDSFLLPSSEARQCMRAAHQMLRNFKKRYTVRNVGNDAHRCWRIK